MGKFYENEFYSHYGNMIIIIIIIKSVYMCLAKAKELTQMFP